LTIFCSRVCQHNYTDLKPERCHYVIHTVMMTDFAQLNSIKGSWCCVFVYQRFKTLLCWTWGTIYDFQLV